MEKTGIKYVGVWQKAQTYRKGDVVTHDGSMWVSLKADNSDAPGKGDSWQLAVKAGKDAR